MATFHATNPGNASNPNTWTEAGVPGPTDHWITEVGIHLDAGITSPELDSGGEIEVANSTVVLDANVAFTVNAGAAFTIDEGTCALDLLGNLLFDGGTLNNRSNLGSSDNSNAVIGAWNNALLVNATLFFLGRWMPQSMDDGSGGPTTVRLQYTMLANGSATLLPSTATYLPPAEVYATVADGATIDFVTRDAAGVIADPDFLPTLPVLHNGAITDTIVTLRRNGPAVGSYTATFPTPTAGTSYYVPVYWQIGGNAYIQEVRVNVFPDFAVAVLDVVASGHNTAGTIGAKINTAASGGAGLTQQQVADALLLAPSGSAASGSVMDTLVSLRTPAGDGSVTTTLTVQQRNGAVLPGCQVAVFLDSACTQPVPSTGIQITNRAGKVTFYLDPGTYWVKKTMPGVNIRQNPQQISVA